MREAIIAPQNEGKGRTFTATCLASIEADYLWSGGLTDTNDQRPVWAMFAGSEQEMRPFMANLRSGRKCELPKNNRYSHKGDRMEFLKTAGYQVIWQRESEGSMATIYLPDLFLLDPGMVDPEGASFLVMPTVEWVKSQKIDVVPLVQHVLPVNYQGEPKITQDELAELAPTAYLFAAYLDRRTRCPLVSDGRFYLQLLVACLKEGLASFADDGSYGREMGQHRHFGFRTIGTSELGFGKGVAFCAIHSEIERVLAEQVQIFFQKVGG